MKIKINIMGIILFILAFLIAILIAVKISTKSNTLVEDDLIAVGDLVEFQQEFNDGYYAFYPGERAWVTEFADYNHVLVSNMPDASRVSDGYDPLKFCTAPISILKKVTSK